MLVLDYQVFKIYNNPIYFFAPISPISKDIMGQINVIIDNHDIHTFSSLNISSIYEEDIFVLEDQTNNN
jgi:hypothetical protein